MNRHHVPLILLVTALIPATLTAQTHLVSKAKTQTNVATATPGPAPTPTTPTAARATYHDSFSGLRELAIREQPRQLLRSVKGLELVELTDAEVCCGFGGTFSVKYPDISNAIVARKT